MTKAIVPSSSSAVVLPSNKKDCFDHVVSYLSSRDGAGDCFDAVVHSVNWMSHYPWSDHASKQLDKVRTGLDLAGSAFNIFAIFESINSLRHHASKSHEKRISRIAKDSLDIVNNSSETALFLHSVEIVDLKEAAPYVECIFQGSSLITDSWDLVNQVQKIHKYEDKLQENLSLKKRDYYERKTVISQIKIIKDIASIAMAAIALISLFFGALIQGIIILPTLFLGLSTIYLVLTIAKYFHEQMLKEKKKLLLQKA